MIINCTKTKFATEKDAQFYINKIKKKSTRAVIPTRAYLCRCGTWHLTSKKDFVVENNTLLLRIVELEEQVKNLTKQVSNLKEDNISLRSGSNKELSLAVKTDDRVKKLNDTLAINKSTLNILRKSNSELITRLVQLEKEKKQWQIKK